MESTSGRGSDQNKNEDCQGENDRETLDSEDGATPLIAGIRSVPTGPFRIAGVRDQINIQLEQEHTM